jgi:DNA (cytosine-5)-methyltransferase 1
VPQHRERLFIVGTKGEDFLFPCPIYGPDSPTQYPHFSAIEAIEGADASEIPSDFSLGGRFGHLLKDIPPGLNYSFYTEKMGHPQPVFAWRSKFSDFLYKADPEKPVRTIKAQGGQYTGPFHWDNRPFSVDEFKRLQTIPDAYRIIGSRQIAIHQIGNSVPPQLARVLALSIMKQLFEVKLPFHLPLLEHHQELSFRKRKRYLTTHYRKKAKTAIKYLKVNIEKSNISARNYAAVLNDNFEWTTSSSGQVNDFYVKFVPDTQIWKFFISTYPEAKNYPLKIVVASSPVIQWGLDVERIELLGTTIAPKLFTALWKAFEAELAHLVIKADLVQLRGYYQYKSAINCSMIFEEGFLNDKWRVVQKVVSGLGVGNILTEQELGQVWEVPPEKIFDYAVFLRQLGYETRNENTNAQIPEGHFLIPYSFPTLNPLSVQLRKSLAGV